MCWTTRREERGIGHNAAADDMPYDKCGGSDDANVACHSLQWPPLSMIDLILKNIMPSFIKH